MLSIEGAYAVMKMENPTFWSGVLQVYHRSHLENFKTEILEPSNTDSVGLGWGPRSCISKKLQERVKQLVPSLNFEYKIVGTHWEFDE